MSGYLKVGDYTKAGFWYLAFKKGYISFCRDVQLLNEEPVCQEDMNLAWVQTIEALHARWVEGDGARGSKMQHDKYLQMAKLQTKSEQAEKYWQEAIARYSNPGLLDSGGDLAGLDMSSLVTSHDTNMRELDDDEYYDDATLAQIYRPIYAFGTGGGASQIGNVDGMSEEMQLETQMSLFNMSKESVKSVVEKAEDTRIAVGLAEKMRTLMGGPEQMDMTE